MSGYLLFAFLFTPFAYPVAAWSQLDRQLCRDEREAPSRQIRKW